MFELDDRLEDRNVISGLGENSCGFFAHVLVQTMTDNFLIDPNANLTNMGPSRRILESTDGPLEGLPDIECARQTDT